MSVNYASLRFRFLPFQRLHILLFLFSLLSLLFLLSLRPVYFLWDSLAAATLIISLIAIAFLLLLRRETTAQSVLPVAVELEAGGQLLSAGLRAYGNIAVRVMAGFG